MSRKLEWTDAARNDVRRIDRESALRILEGLARFLFTEEGDVKRLKGSDPAEYRYFLKWLSVAARPPRSAEGLRPSEPKLPRFSHSHRAGG